MPDLTAVFAELRSILAPYVASLSATKDDPSELYLNTTVAQKNGKPHFFAAVQVRKSFVSFHLMPVYDRPALLDGLSPDLRRRMQGKSCFNFTEVDKPLLQELGALTRAGYESYKDQGFV